MCDGSVSGAVLRALRKARAARRQRIDRRRQSAADAIGAQRVDGDEQDVGFLCAEAVGLRSPLQRGNQRTIVVRRFTREL